MNLREERVSIQGGHETSHASFVDGGQAKCPQTQQFASRLRIACHSRGKLSKSDREKTSLGGGDSKRLNKIARSGKPVSQISKPVRGNDRLGTPRHSSVRGVSFWGQTNPKFCAPQELNCIQPSPEGCVSPLRDAVSVILQSPSPRWRVSLLSSIIGGGVSISGALAPSRHNCVDKLFRLPPPIRLNPKAPAFCCGAAKLSLS